MDGDVGRQSENRRGRERKTAKRRHSLKKKEDENGRKK